MDKKRIIKICISISLALLLLIMHFTGYPAKWFVSFKSSELMKDTVPFLINNFIIFSIALISYFLLGYFKKTTLKAFTKYIVIAALLFVISLGANVLGRYKDLGYKPSSTIVVLEGIIGPFLSNLTVIFLFIGLLGEGLLLPPINKFKNTIVSSIIAVLFIILSYCFNLELRNLARFYYVAVAFGISYFATYILIKDSDTLTPAIYYAICGIAIIPVCYTGNTKTPDLTIFIVSILYLLVGSIYLGIIIRDDLKLPEAKENE